MDPETDKLCKSPLNSSDFDPETFVGNLILKKGLDELVAVEEDMVENVRRLDSEMQHLVYENYNKFLTATNAVRRMQRDFKNMEENLDSLSSQMILLQELSSVLASQFDQNREVMSGLKDSTADYKVLSYIISMPSRLQKLIDKGRIDRAVLMYSKLMQSMEGANKVNFMSGVMKEVNEIMGSLECKLRQQLRSADDSIEYVHNARLLNLLCFNDQKFLDSLIKQWRTDLNTEMEQLEENASFQNDRKSPFSDVLDCVERGVCPFLTNVSLVVTHYSNLFNKPMEGEMLDVISTILIRLKLFLIKLFVSDLSAGCALYVRALDKAYRKICAVCKLLDGFDFEKGNTEFVLECTQHQVELCRKSVTTNLRQTLAEFAIDDDKESLNRSVQLLRRLESTFLTSVKSSLANLLLFAASDVTFFNNSNDAFTLSSFGIGVHEHVVVGSIRDIQDIAKDISQPMQLAFAAFLNFSRKHIKYLMDLCAEQYGLNEQITETLLTPSADLLKDINETGISSLKEFIKAFSPKAEGILTNSTKWTNLNTAPLTVRLEVKQFVDDMRCLDGTLRTLLDDNTTKERLNVDSSRRINRRLNASPQNGDKNSNNSLEKMWAETVDDFYEPTLEFKRQAVLGNIIYKSLRLYLDWLRGHSFSMFGVQQLQIDSFYFKQNLWHFAADEMSINVLIDELLSLAVNVCENPKLLEPAVVRNICGQ